MMAKMGRPPKYPWDTWLNGERHVLEPGVDFKVPPYSMRRQILLEARKREIPVATRVARGWIEITVRSAPEPGARTDWDAVFAKDPAMLEHGEDFTGPVESMISAARHAAKRRGLKCSIEVSADSVLTIRSWRDPALVGRSASEMADEA